MNKVKKTSIISIILLFTLIAAGKVHPETELTAEYQQDLFDRLNHIRGGPRPASLENIDRSICGTSVAFEAFINREKMDGVYKNSAAMQVRDTSLECSYESPDGRFLIHYDTVGADAVYEPGLDTLAGGDGIPDYINKVAEIADSVWIFIIDDLGYPEPPHDDFYPSGLDSTYDIYVEALSGSYYGATYSEMAVDSQAATSVVVIDNDYSGFYPYDNYDGDPGEFNRRLDAVRVTVAHEFFHAIHFGMDWTEWEGSAQSVRMYWWEMSATWMEEMMYDDINDYYYYLYSFFELPWIGLRNFTASSSAVRFHPYASAIFPIYLTERWGDPVIVRKIWEQCRDLGLGPNFGEAVDKAVFEVSGGTDRLADAIGEFSVWNMFTGARASRAPAGVGYSEKEFYPIIPDSVMFEFDSFPVIINNEVLKDMFGLKLPEMYGANIIKLDKTYLIPDSLGFFFFRSNDYSMLDWNISLIGMPLNDRDNAIVKMNRFEGPRSDQYIINNTDELFNLYAVITPVSDNVNIFNFGQRFDYAFAVLDSLPDDTVSTVKYTLKAYPNPCITANSCETFNFEIVKSFVDANRAPSKLSITILNVASEIVRTIQYDFVDPANSDNPNYPHNFNTVFRAEWDLKNEHGIDVASGVYMAWWKLTFTGFSESEPVIQKSKFVVIR